MDCDTVAFAAGGTLGHISPAVALAQTLKKISPQISCVLIKDDRFNQEMIHFPGEIVTIQVPRLHCVTAVLKLFTFFKSVRNIRSLFKEKSIKGLVATGGYACLPSLVAARLEKIPFWLLEQNQVPGRVVRLFKGSAKHTWGPQGCVVHGIDPLGVPVEFDKRTKNNKANFHETINIVVSGGSLGAQVLDRRVPQVLNQINHKHQFNLIHFSRVETEYLTYEPAMQWQHKRPSYDFKEDLVHADVLIGRAGGSTIAECDAFGVPQILIPLPHAKDNHQWHNAVNQVKRGHAIMLEESQTNEIWLNEMEKFLTRENLVSFKEKMNISDNQLIKEHMAHNIVKCLNESIR